MYELIPTYPLKKPRQKPLWIKAFTGSRKSLIKPNQLGLHDITVLCFQNVSLPFPERWLKSLDSAVCDSSSPPIPTLSPALGTKGFSGGSDSKESACSAGDPGLIPGLGRSPGEGNGYPTPVFLPGEFHGQRSLAGYCPWGWKESDMTGAWTWIVRLNKDSVVDALHSLCCCYFCYKPWKEVYNFLILMPSLLRKELLLILVQIK